MFSSGSSNSCLTTGRIGLSLGSCLTFWTGLETGRDWGEGKSRIGLSLIWSLVIGTGFSGLKGAGDGLGDCWNSSSSVCLMAEVIAGILNLLTCQHSKSMLICLQWKSKILSE